METPEAAPADAPASALESSPPAAIAGSPAALIEALYERRYAIRTLLVASIDDEHNAEVAWNTPATPSHLAHLLRMADVKLDRLYLRGMFPPREPAGPVAGVPAHNRPFPAGVGAPVDAAQ